LDTWKRFSEKEASHSMVHYVQAVAEVAGRNGTARAADVAAHLGVSKSGVTSMVRSLQARGLVAHERYGELALTEAGRRLAERTAANREVLTLFLTEILGVPTSVALEDACMVEHLVSPQVMTELLRLTTFLRSGDPLAAQLRRAFRPRDEARQPAGDAS
jgi:DtxR family Mn-dependent transcriptional regulator